jgi:hypothetical protein
VQAAASAVAVLPQVKRVKLCESRELLNIHCRVGGACCVAGHACLLFFGDYGFKAESADQIGLQAIQDVRKQLLNQ